MQLFDFHCDTLYRAVNESKTINEEQPFHLSVDRGKNYDKWLQCMAIWIPDELRNEDATNLFLTSFEKLKNESKINNIELVSDFKNIGTNNDYGLIFTVENGSVLAGKIENVELLAKCNVKIVTLTWNGHNEIGDGADVENPIGITEFGEKVINEFEKNKIVVDVSHASDKLFYDVAEIASKPFIATHSNSRKITNHRRNLTEEQFLIIANNGGVVGLNFCNTFLCNNPENVSMNDILKHAEHFLSIGGENTICLGTDFDGTDVPPDINGIEGMSNLYELFLKENYSEELVKKIFWNNAINFCQNFDN